jgi:putative hydrolase
VLHLNTKAKIEKNTQAYIKAIENNKVDIIAHLGYGIKVNPVKIAEVAAKHETYIELNAKHLSFTDSQMQEMINTGVKFIISSDAHHYSSVGKNNVAYALIERLNIPHSQVVNLLDVPKFKNYNLNKKY